MRKREGEKQERRLEVSTVFQSSPEISRDRGIYFVVASVSFVKYCLRVVLTKGYVREREETL